MHLLGLAYRLAQRQHPGMTWKPITEAAIYDKLNAAQDRMSVRQARLWDAIRIPPEKWGQEPWGQAGAGFWTVGLIGRIVIWFNDIEDGFNRSSYDRYRTIKEYCCNQDELEHAVQRVLDTVETGYEVGPFSGPPQPGEFDRAPLILRSLHDLSKTAR